MTRKEYMPDLVESMFYAEKLNGTEKVYHLQKVLR